MQNLVYPVKRILINSWTTKELGYYTKTDPDTSATERQLLFKKANVEIPFVSGTTTVTKSCTADGIVKSVLLKTLAPAPCLDCNYNYGIEIVKKTKNPGVLNDDYYSKSREFGGKLDSIITPVNGQLDDVDKLTIEDDIITQIAADQGAISMNREVGVVRAKRIYVVEIDLTATEVLKYTVAGHAPATVAMSGGVTALTAIYDLNGDATFNDHLVAFKKDATHIFVTSLDPETLFTLEDGGGVTPLVSLERFIWIYGKDPEYKFQVRFDMGFAQITRFNLLVLTNGAAGATHTTMVVNKVASGDIDGAANSFTYAANINGSSVTAYVMASAITAAANVAVYVYTDIYEARVLTLTTLVTIAWQGSGAGVYSNMTSKDIFRLFMNEKHLGGQSNFAYATEPVDGGKYCKLTFTFVKGQGALDGANHITNHAIHFEVYILQGISDTAKWDAHNYMWENTTDDATFAADKTFNEVLTAWYGGTLTVK